jgi:hypothetical protein
MKLYFLFAIIDVIVLLVYPIAYIAYHVQKLRGARLRRRNVRYEKGHFHFG